ncbi:MAG: enoyl-CoA hydratase/isomerase family protein, partial [Acetobacteraceae bacterium]|nr:enoyl-CoA hydratase/isomerase family protein [Acetobacteraceae bacterium]
MLAELAGPQPTLRHATADPVAALAGFAGPVIAAVNGAAVAGGFELDLACDVVLAAEEARFADTHARVGVLPGWGLSQRLPRLIGPGRAKELSLTGNFLGARRAEAWG